MEAVAAIGAWAFGNSSFSNGLQTFFPSYSNSPSTTIMNELFPLLSDKSLISFPGSPEFLEATTWWQEYNKANITIVVEPTTEADVQATVKYANLHGVQFLARTGGHGAINSLAAVDQGIEIWMRRMNSVAIAPDGKTATFGGGVMSMEVTDTLWEAKKQTVTGVCECTSMVGPMLGGGHGVLQGRYGLISDNLISARVVQANGSAVTASSTENSDLFWALQWAGHNFGIITKFTSKIYDVPDNSDWAHETYIYTHDKAEAVFDQINKQTDDGVNPVPMELLSWAYFLHLPHIDPVKPVIIFTNLYEGAEQVPDQYTKPFHAIGPVFTQLGVASYLDVPAITGNGKDQAGCTHGDSILRFPFQTKTYNVDAQRKVLDAFGALTAEYPAFNRSVFLLEGYPLHGVKAIKDEATAFPHRGDNLILCPVVIYAPNATLDFIAIEFGQRVRRIWHEASGSEEMHAYVNYAHGDETLEELYGYEPWRIEKLKGLKKKYDPEGRFGFYAPISQRIEAT